MKNESAPRAARLRRLNAYAPENSALVLLGIAISVCIASLAMATTVSQDDSISLIADADRTTVLKGSTEPIFVMVQMDAKEIPVDQQAPRPPVNLSLVLDRSGSMEDKGKIEYLKGAAKLAVDRLTAKDYVSIVEYDDEITLMWPSSRVESPAPIHRLIDQLSPRGSTNLTGGMMRGVEEVADTMKDLDGANAIHRVLLFSDGLVNTGIQEPQQIKQKVKDAKQQGVRISTMGLGRDYDEDLMQMIAEHGGGSYYFIENPKQMTRIFELELDTLFTTIGKDVEIDFARSNAIDSAEILSFGANRDAGSAQTELPNFYSGDTQVLVFKLQPKENAFGNAGQPVSLGSVNLSYTNVETGQIVQLSKTLQVDVSDQQDLVDQSTNNDVVVEARLLEAEMVQAQAVKEFEKGNQENAQKMMNDLATQVAAQNVDLKDDRLANKVEAIQVETEQMASAAAAPEEQAIYLKSTKQRLYQAGKGKRSLYQLKVGDKGYEVERLQQALKDEGYYAGPIDGVYTEDVRLAVEEVQRKNNLSVDGVAGPSTMRELSIY